jgi:hypothetical protein
MLNNLKAKIKQDLLAAFAKALRVALNYPSDMISHVGIQKITNMATLNMFSNYKLALLLYQVYNEQIPKNEWLHLN